MPLSNLSSYQPLLDAIDVPVFVVDDDVRLLAMNDAAKEMFGLREDAFYLRRGGEVLHCLRADDVPEGCGHGPHCGTCVIRNSVAASLKGSQVSRRRMKLQRRTETGTREQEVLISARALPESGPNITVLTVEDITEVSRLREIIPICMMCKKIRDDQQYWRQVETYFSNEIGVDFSHGICPACEVEYRKRNLA